jgi:hypothetical protein
MLAKVTKSLVAAVVICLLLCSREIYGAGAEASSIPQHSSGSRSAAPAPARPAVVTRRAAPPRSSARNSGPRVARPANPPVAYRRPVAPPRYRYNPPVTPGNHSAVTPHPQPGRPDSFRPLTPLLAVHQFQATSRAVSISGIDDERRALRLQAGPQRLPWAEVGEREGEPRRSAPGPYWTARRCSEHAATPLHRSAGRPPAKPALRRTTRSARSTTSRSRFRQTR